APRGDGAFEGRARDSGVSPGSLDRTGLGLVWGDLRSWGGDRLEGKPRRFGPGRGEFALRLPGVRVHKPVPATAAVPGLPACTSLAMTSTAMSRPRLCESS